MTTAGVAGQGVPSLRVQRNWIIYRVIHKSLRDFRTRLRNIQDWHSRKEHINRQRISPIFFCVVGAVAYLQVSPLEGISDKTWRGQGIRKCSVSWNLPQFDICRVTRGAHIEHLQGRTETGSVSPSVDMLPFGVTIPATVPQGAEIPEKLMNHSVYICIYTYICKIESTVYTTICIELN
jgi:hypothetical protein